MKLTIRKGMFETNSSSMHSIIITKDGNNCYEKGLKAGYGGTIYFSDEEQIQEINNLIENITFNFVN